MASQTVELLRIVNDLAKVRRLLNELKELTNAKPIDRDRCMHILREIYASYLSALMVSVVAYVSGHKKLRRRLKIITTLVEEGSHDIINVTTYCTIVKFEKEISMIAEELGIQQPVNEINDEAIANNITAFYSKFTAILNAIEQTLDIPSSFQYLASLIEYGFDINWIIAVAHLTAMEIATNNALERLEINVDEKSKVHEKFGTSAKEGFKSRVNTLLKELEKRGAQFGELEKLLPQTFWELRNKVVHGGYTPSEEELQVIVLAVNKFLEKLRGTSPK